MIKEYLLPSRFHCPECGGDTAYAAIIDTSQADAPIICNECGFAYGNVGTLRHALATEGLQVSERDSGVGTSLKH